MFFQKVTTKNQLFNYILLELKDEYSELLCQQLNFLRNVFKETALIAFMQISLTETVAAESNATALAVDITDRKTVMVVSIIRDN